MNERKHEAKCMEELRQGLLHAWLWKIRDITTGGQPDLEVAWNGHTTKLEFKVLKGDETVQDKWEDERQLVTLVRYEQQTQRAWLVAWRPKHKDFPAATYIYRPTALLGGKVPPAKRCDTFYDLWNFGVAWWPEVRYDVVTDLIRTTHV